MGRYSLRQGCIAARLKPHRNPAGIVRLPLRQEHPGNTRLASRAFIIRGKGISLRLAAHLFFKAPSCG